MSYLLETLGRGWIGRLSAAFRDQLEEVDPRAIEQVRRDLESSPDCHDLRVELGFSYLRAGQCAKARDAFVEAVDGV